ncbi:alpha/beta hydrolase [Streptomyces sp. SID2888]|uniref:alpha/beta hydrolase n=1 Tax=Streptomyces sp. SID2888 TaxID=2690256 RepID=UPI00136CB21B|nr:alpha/beta hydrolase [Streptomyces sp. SID2888]MYV49935.1 hypothetical protein [Streptomyces sp. SID2888]
MDLETLKSVAPSGYADAADGYRAVSDMADAAKDRVDRQIAASLRKAEEGEAADAALKQLRRLSENFHYTQVECGLISGALNGFSSEITAPRRRLLEALDDAKALSYSVDADGGVGYPAGGGNEATGGELPGGTVQGNTGRYTPGLGPDDSGLHSPNPHRAKAQDIADRIAHAVQEATETDVRYSGALARLRAAPGLGVGIGTWADVASDVQAVSSAASRYLQDHIPLDKTPADRKQWWDGLSAEQRDEYKRAFPELIGNLDGIPSAIRDEVNRENLPLLIASLEGKDDEDSRTKLGGLKRIQERLNTVGAPPMYLLGIGDEGNGRAIISFGDPDTSKNISAYVPGLDTKLDKEFADGTVNRAFYTAKLGREMNPSTASIVWLGYDAPQMTPLELFSGSSVMLTNNAELGAPAYNSFMSGIAATNESADPHVTAIGHSYGSLTVGTAAKQPGGIPGVDDIVLVGSPGAGVDKASDLGIGKDHVWVGSADNDVVTRLPSHEEGGSALLGGGLGAVAGGPAGALLGAAAGGRASDRDDDLWFGKDPASAAFGANRFKTLPGPTLVSMPDVWNSDLSFDAHSNYFNPEAGKDQVSARNIAAVIAGEPGYVSREKPR